MTPGTSAVMPTTTEKRTPIALVALLATGVLDGLNSPLWGSLAQIFAGPPASGRWMGMQNSVVGGVS
jgi:hypothetical protein